MFSRMKAKDHIHPTHTPNLMDPHDTEYCLIQFMWTNKEDQLPVLCNQFSQNWQLIADVFNSSCITILTNIWSPGSGFSVTRRCGLEMQVRWCTRSQMYEWGRVGKRPAEKGSRVQLRKRALLHQWSNARSFENFNTSVLCTRSSRFPGQAHQAFVHLAQWFGWHSGGKCSDSREKW